MIIRQKSRDRTLNNNIQKMKYESENKSPLIIKTEPEITLKQKFKLKKKTHKCDK